jgi:hypothetical protein
MRAWWCGICWTWCDPCFVGGVQIKELLREAGASDRASVLGGATLAGFIASAFRSDGSHLLYTLLPITVLATAYLAWTCSEWAAPRLPASSPPPSGHRWERVAECTLVLGDWYIRNALLSRIGP